MPLVFCARPAAWSCPGGRGKGTSVPLGCPVCSSVPFNPQKLDKEKRQSIYSLVFWNSYLSSNLYYLLPFIGPLLSNSFFCLLLNCCFAILNIKTWNLEAIKHVEEENQEVILFEKCYLESGKSIKEMKKFEMIVENWRGTEKNPNKNFCFELMFHF